MKTPSASVKPSAPTERAFFYFLTFVFVGVFIQTVVTVPAARQPLHLLALAVLLALHISIHWQVVGLELKPGWVSAYVIGQGLLAFIICILSGSISMIFSLYMALIGEVTGVYNHQRPRLLAAIGYYILLTLISYGLVFGWNTIQWWALAILPLTLFVYIYVSLYNRQTEARNRAQSLLRELEVANQQLTEYSARVEDLTIAAERQRMARELHDTLSQGLAGLILQLEAADAHLANGRSERAQAIVQQAMLQARLTLADSRRAIDDLRSETQPGTADQSGASSPVSLEGALRQEAENFSRASGIPCALDLNLPPELPAALIEPARRTVQEGLANITHHAHASQAALKAIVQDGCLVIELQDNGSGFDPQSVENQAGHYGLMGMRERARLAGGSLEVTSAPGQGSQLRLSLPLESKG